MSEEVNRAWKAQYMLRMPEGLRDRIKRAAEREGRSMNAEIVRVLEREFPDAPLTAEDFVQYLQDLTGDMSLEGQIEKQHELNYVLKYLGVDLEAQLESGDLILSPKNEADR